MARLKAVPPNPSAEPPPPGRRDRTRGALVKAGETLMAAKSVDAIAIDEIVDLAGVAKGTFYNHFPDKESLQQAVLEDVRGDLRRMIDRENAGIADPARRVARAFCVVLRYAVEHPERGNFLIRTSMAFRLVQGRMNVGLVKDIGIGLTEGRFPIATNESGVLLMLGITQAAMVQTLEHVDPFSVASRAQQLGAMLLRGLGLSGEEAELIAAQEADHIICRHEFPPLPPAAH